MSELTGFMLSFGFNFLVALLVVRGIYYPSNRDKRYVFTFLAFNTIIYFVLSFMNSVELTVGVGFGLFAIFSILRYRTDPVPIREMTYLFIIVALPVMNSAGANNDIWPQLILANLAVLLIMLVLEKGWGFRYEASKRIIYEKIELIQPERYPELMADLEMRTGLKIKRAVVGKVDFVRDTAELKIYYDDTLEGNWLENGEDLVLSHKDQADD